MSQKLRKALTGTSSTTEQQALSVWRTTVKSLYAAANTQRKNKGGVTDEKKGQQSKADTMIRGAGA